MAPEQARGEVDRIDERADVFGLGAILCEILTGRPPFAGSTREEIRAQAARGEVSDALTRLHSCGAEIELVALARDCLAAQPEHRLRSAGEVLRRLTAYVAGVQDRLKAAELARVEAQARAEEAQARARIERSRRLRTMALAASVMVIAGLVSGGWAYLTRQRQERAGRFSRALGEAEALYVEARRAGDDTARWLTARDAAQAVEHLLADTSDDSARRRATALVRDVTQAAAAAENDQKLLATLVDIRSAKADDPDGSATDAAYADAFREAGIDVGALPPAEAGAKIQARPAAVRVALAAALDDWAAELRNRGDDKAGAEQIIEVARLADPDPWRNRLRELLYRFASQDRRKSLRELAKSARIEELPAVSVILLGGTLFNMGDPTGAEAVLREGQRLYPGDVWINFNLGECLERLARRDEAIRYYMAARSLRPETAHDLAHALERKGETDQAIALFQDLARLRPEDGRHLGCLGAALKGRGRSHEATAVLEAAIATSRAAIGLKPDLPGTHIALGNALKELGKQDEAITEYREALRLKPDYAMAHNDLGLALTNQGELREAIAEFREALRLKPDYPAAHNSLGVALKDQGKLDEAIVEFRETLRLKPDYAEAHINLGGALRNQGKPDEAIAEYRTALRFKPDYAKAFCNLGHALRQQGCFVEALAEFKRGHEIGSKDPNWRVPSAVWVRETERLVELDRKLPAILAGQVKPADAAEMLGFAQLCYEKKLHGASARLWAEAFQAQPKLAEDMKVQNRYNAACAAALAGSGQGKNDPPLDDAAQARWRKQAIDWLKADLAAWSKILEGGPPQARQAISRTLQHWKVDTDLAGIRDQAALAKLPEDEQKTCRALWDEVEAILKKAR